MTSSSEVATLESIVVAKSLGPYPAHGESIVVADLQAGRGKGYLRKVVDVARLERVRAQRGNAHRDVLKPFGAPLCADDDFGNAAGVLR